MIVTLKPDLGLLAAARAEPQSLLCWPSHVLHEKNRQYCWEGAGPTSIKTFFNGRALYESGRGRYVVDSNSYLVLNHGQQYSICIDSEAEVESFCLFFAKEFANDVYRSLATATTRLLDQPEMTGESTVNFFEKTYPHDDILSPALFCLRASLPKRKDEQGWLEGQLSDVLQRLLQVHREVHKEVEGLAAVRAATREELYRRLNRAKDYISASFHEPVMLGDVARVACLSPNHLLRTFKQAFRQTPHQFLTAKRLEQARKLLTHTDQSVTDICFSVGFASVGSFSWLFHRHVGVSPENYRLQKGDFEEAELTLFSV